ncbi:hypothetical protein KOXY103107_11795 [Komagataeibacter xylinus]
MYQGTPDASGAPIAIIFHIPAFARIPALHAQRHAAYGRVIGKETIKP